MSCVCILCTLGKRSGFITTLTVGTTLEQLLKEPKFNSDDKMFSYSQNRQNAALFCFERYFLRIFSVTSHLTRTTPTNSNNVFPESSPFVLSLCALTHTYIYIYIYIYSTDDDDVNDDVNEFRKRRFCAEFSAPVLCSI